MKEISVKELQTKIDNNEPMLVSFSASWCGPCKVLAEEMKKLDSKLPVYKVDVEEDVDFLFARLVDVNRRHAELVLTRAHKGVEGL